MNKIKEKLLKDLKKYKKEDGTVAYDEYGNYLGVYNWGRIITILEAKLQQHEETSKAKDEEFIKILEADILLFEQVSKCLDCEGCKKIINKRIEEIKQRIKEE